MSLKHRIAAWRELWQRYKTTWTHFWQRRQELSLPDFKEEEAEFLPAALSLQARPVSPAGRWVARLLILLVITLLVWSILGKSDIIVNAQGKIIPGGYTKTLTAVEIASVHALHVSEGQAVHQGEVLVELDPRISDTEWQKAEGERQSALLQETRAIALLKAIDTGKAPQLPALSGLDPERWQMARGHLLDQWRDYTAKQARFDSEIHHYSQALPLARQRAQDYAELAQSHDVARHAWMEKEQARIDIEGQLAEARAQKAALTAEIRKTAQDARNEANRIAASAAQEAQKARVHGDLLKLTAPVDGTVQQLTIHTVGAAVPAAQPLMQIVPKRAQIEMEAFIENKDIGFVVEGQEAQVKIDTFEYTKYGTVAATVSHVSRDAIQDEKRGLIYAVRVALKQPSMIVQGKEVALSPGMSGSVEIKTGTRRMIEYVLAPLLQHGRESLHER